MMPHELLCRPKIAALGKNFHSLAARLNSCATPFDLKLFLWASSADHGHLFVDRGDCSVCVLQTVHNPFTSAHGIQSHDRPTEIAVPTLPGLVLISDLLYPVNSSTLCRVSNLSLPISRRHRSSWNSVCRPDHVIRSVPRYTSSRVIHQLLLRGEYLSPRRILSGDA